MEPSMLDSLAAYQHILGMVLARTAHTGLQAAGYAEGVRDALAATSGMSRWPRQQVADFAAEVLSA